MKNNAAIPQIGLLDLSGNIQSQLKDILEVNGYVTIVMNSEYSSEFDHFEQVNIVIFELHCCKSNYAETLEGYLSRFRVKPTTISLVKDSCEERTQAYACGAHECIYMPIIAAELLTRVKGSLDIPHCEPDKAPLVDSGCLLVIKVSYYLLERLGENFSIKRLEQHFGVNRNKLASAFKQQYGVPVFTWLREQRMKAAAEMFIATNKSVHQVAYAVGYEDSNNFSTCFKRAYGKSPVSYRKQMRQTKKVVPFTKEVLFVD